jgi:hypothetical protein
MVHIFNKSPFLLSKVLLVCIVLILLIASSVQADVGVQPILPDGSNIQPGAETPIQMSAEKVEFFVRQATEWDRAAIKFNAPAYGFDTRVPVWTFSVAEVIADFSMLNPTRLLVSMPVWFPMATTLRDDDWTGHVGEVVPRIENFQVIVDGEQLVYDVSELSNPQGAELPALPWASFPITFPAGGEVKIHVTYTVWAQPDISGVGMQLYYIFQTGAGWSGPIGKADLVLNLPYPASVETIGAMPEGGTISDYQVRWTWQNLEPGAQDNFSIWLLSQERWKELETAKIQVTDDPENGEAWLKLATTYQYLWEMLTKRGPVRPGFSETYQQLGVQAALRAAHLLPDNVWPHYILAMLYSAALPQNPSPPALQPVWDEMDKMKELDPDLAQGLEPNVYDVLEWVLYNDATATAQAGSWATQAAADTAVAQMTLTPSPSATLQPSQTSPPLPTPSLTVVAKVDGRSTILGVAILVIILVVVGIMVGSKSYKLGKH